MKSTTSKNSAVALILVLGFLVIISALAVAFFASVTTELRASRTFQANVNTRQLQDSVINIVEGQIRQATVVDPNLLSTQNRAWISQPGLIQTFGDGNGGASATLLMSYKLYSSNAMTMDHAVPSADYEPKWELSPALWTDLNAPVMDPDPTNASGPSLPRFPIIDPRANDHDNPEATIGKTVGNLVEGFHYPSTGAVDGTVYSPNGGTDARLPMPVRWLYVLRDGRLTAPTGIGSGTNGSIQASFSSAAIVPTKANPIVGRVAFWTDDDTSKLNINVAGGAFFDPNNPPNNYTADHYAGSFWDTPRVNSTFDQGVVYGPGVSGFTPGASGNGGGPLPNLAGLAAVQMRQNEFQRYPGHPATTSMANVFKSVLTAENLYQVTPRIHGGSDTTKGGTNRQHNQTVPGASTNNLVQDIGLPIRYDRLYDSVDEMLFAYQTNHKQGNLPRTRRTNFDLLGFATETSPTFNPYSGGTGGSANDVTQFSPALLDRLRFFLTAYNRSPELNLFGHPKVSVWPVRSQTYNEDVDPQQSGLNAYDSLSLFCATIGPSVYKYKNFNSDGPSAANSPYHYSIFRKELPSSLTGVTLDIDLPRNKQLITYLHDLLAQPIPGFGGQSFKDKYGQADINETLVEIFDYIRCANLYDTTTTNTGSNPKNPHPFSPSGIVMPSTTKLDGFTQLGMGRFPTICEATLVFYYAGSDVTQKNQADQTLYAAAPQTQTVAPTPVGPPQFNETSGVLVITPPDFPFANPTPTAAEIKLGVQPKNATQVPTVRLMRAALLLSTFNPMQGYGPIAAPGAGDPKITFEVSGLDAMKISGPGVNTKYNTQPFPTVTSGTPGVITLNGVSGSYWGGRNFGGFEGFAHTLNVGSIYPLLTPVAAPMGLVVNPLPQPQDPTKLTPPQAAGTIIPLPNADYQEVGGPPTFTVSQCTAHVLVKFGGVKLQTIDLPFPQATLPAPRGDDIIDAEPFSTDPNTFVTLDTAGKPVVAPGKPILRDSRTRQDNNPTQMSNGWQNFPTGGPQSYGQLRRWYWSQELGSFDPNAARTVPARVGNNSQPPGFNIVNPKGKPPQSEGRGLSDARDYQKRINFVLNAPVDVNGNPVRSDATLVATTTQTGPVIAYRAGKWRQLLQPGDTVRSLIFCEPPSGTTATASGDLRLAAVSPALGSPSGKGKMGFFPHPDYLTNKMQQACLLRMADGELYYNYASAGTDLFFSQNAVAGTGLGSFGASGTQYSTFNPFGNHVSLSTTNIGANGKQFPQNFAVANLPRQLSAGANAVWTNGVNRADNTPGDFDTGLGAYPDGPYFNKQDEGNAIFAKYDQQTGVTSYPIPYFGDGSYSVPGNAFNAPNRQMPSPGMIGSLLSRAASGNPWETICLCPSPAGTSSSYTAFGNTSTKDHLLLDLLEMPIVQPYPISEPFSTAGKVNLNFNIQPFDYIERSTAVRAVLGSERVTHFGAADGTGVKVGSQPSMMYQSYKDQSQEMTTNVRYILDNKRTMATMREWLALPENRGVFRSPTQICEIYLIDAGMNSSVTTIAQAMNFWRSQDLTGDNVREKPYADMVPRLTTKSNTFTIHMKVQSLRQNLHPTDKEYLTWDEAKDFVLGEYRGSSSIERYIDPSDRHFNPNDPITTANHDGANPDSTAANTSLEAYYRFRTVNTKLFAP